MTTEPAPETATASGTETVDPDDVAYPLSAYVQGLLTIQFAGGAVVRRETSQYDARTFLDMQRGDRNSDRLTWTAAHWYSWQDREVVFTSFDKRRDQTWEIAPEDRRRLADAGHEDGVASSLVRMWERSDRSDEPMYSIRVIVALHSLALIGEDRATWEEAARLFEGTSGAQRFGRAFKGGRGGSSGSSPTSPDVPADHVRDSVEPEDEPTDDLEGEPTQSQHGEGSDGHGPEQQSDPGAPA